MPTMTIDRSLLSRYLAKAVAYAEMGESAKAHEFALLLIAELRNAGILPSNNKLSLGGNHGR